MKNILPFNDDPIIKTYPNIAFYLGILEGSNLNVENIVISEFSNLFFFNKRMDFISTGYFQKKLFKNKYKKIRIHNSISNIIKEIDNYNYVVVILNEKYISNKEIPSKNNYYHDWLIYGYDLDNKVFYCAGYYGEQMRLRKYGTIMISFNDVSISLKHSWFNRFCFSSKDTHTIKIKQNLKIKENTFSDIYTEFLNPKFLVLYYRPVINVGIKSLLKFSKMLTKYISNWDYLADKRVRLQSFRIIYEHTKVLLIASERTKDIDLYNRIKEISNKAYMLFILGIEYNTDYNLAVLEKINYFVDEIIAMEKKVFDDLKLDDKIYG